MLDACIASNQAAKHLCITQQLAFEVLNVQLGGSLFSLLLLDYCCIVSQDGIVMNVTSYDATDAQLSTVEVTLARLVPQFVNFTEYGFDTAAARVDFKFSGGVDECTETDDVVVLDSVDVQEYTPPTPPE